jgi:hypothetical protein
MTESENALLKAFRAMDERSQEYILRLAKSQAADCPSPRLRRLRLVPNKLNDHHVSLVSSNAHEVSLHIVRAGDSGYAQ